ncbi:PAS domain-containing sensor histidine kinase [Rhodohalobacter halophilus]|uniref:PAS domain-containing sensor histidine kinase n=1 Tax=Rhodohalobacter halophilus TaxID=1812810 RepID=UPI00083FBAF2|nr:PAS domain-containing sensor histidine kinase [Rhodohalobacter halophilus]
MKNITRTFWVWDVENQEVSVNSNKLNEIGIDLPDSSPSTFWNCLIHPDDQSAFDQKIEAILQNNDCDSITAFSSVCIDGSRIPIKISAEQTGPESVAGQIEFIEQNLSTRDGYLLNLLMKHLPQSIFFKDEESRFIRINQTCAEKFGLDDPARAIGKTDFDFFEDEHAEQALKDEKWVMKTGKPIIDKVEKEVFSGDENRIRWASTTKIPMLDSSGNTIGTFGITRDITAGKKQRDELNETIEIISQQKNRFQNFAHVVSHNLRNHAGNISMILSLMEVIDSEKEKNELLENLATASDRLNDTIADLNEIVDVDAKTDIELKQVSVRDILDKVKDILITDIFIHNVQFEESVPEDFIIKYNSSYLESILLNLVSNAIKYRHPNRVPEITITSFNGSDGPGIQVSDNGKGINLHKHGDDIFGMYKTFHGNSNAKGIGLYLIKNQIESLGGSIEVESVPEQGTKFTVYFSD